MKKYLAACLIIIISFSFCSCTTEIIKKQQAVEWTEIGNSWAELEKWDKAGDAWSKALAVDPKLTIAGYNLVRALAEAGKYKEAILKSDELLAIDPDNVLILEIKAYSLYGIGDFTLAIEIYEKVIKLSGSNIASLYNLAVLIESDGKTEEAIAKYKTILEEAPEHTLSLLRLAALLADNDETIEEAKIYADRYLVSKDVSQEGKKVVASIYSRANDPNSSLKLLKEIVEKDEKDARSYFDMATIYLTSIDDFENGMLALKKAIELGFKDKEYYTQLADNPKLTNAEEVKKEITNAKLYTEKTSK